ncbi:MAG: CARDB domain-containing protein [Chloroflexota bacterium]
MKRFIYATCVVVLSIMLVAALLGCVKAELAQGPTQYPEAPQGEQSNADSPDINLPEEGSGEQTSDKTGDGNPGNGTETNAGFEISNLTVAPSEAKVGDTVTVSATVSNTAEALKTSTVVLLAGGEKQAARSFSLAAGEKREVSFVTKKQQPVTYTMTAAEGVAEQSFTVLEPRPAEFRVANPTARPSEAQPGALMTISAEVTNIGEKPGTCNLILLIEGGAQAMKEISLDAGETSEVSFTAKRTNPGEYSFAIAREITHGSFTITAPDIKVTDLSFVPSEPRPDETITVRATVASTAKESGTYDLELLLDGETMATETLDLAAGQTKDISFDLKIEEAGTYIVSLKDASRSLTVVSPEPAEFKITDFSLSSSQVELGELVNVEAEVTNVGEESGSYDLELRVDGGMYAKRSVTLSEGEEEQVSFHVKAERVGTCRVSLDNLSQTFRVVAPPEPADFKCTDLTVSPSTVKLGESVTVRAEISNVGELSGTYPVKLSVNGITQSTRSLALDGGEKQVTSFEVTPEEAGDCVIGADNMSRTVKVVTPTPAEFEVRDFNVTPTQVRPGEPVTVEATIANVGEQSGTCTIELIVDGEVDVEESVTVAGGEEERISFEVTRDEPGTYRLKIVTE